jgi:hypothetical protein
LIAVRHRAALLSTVLAVTAATLVLPGRSAAAEPGFKVDITELPGTFTAGADARTVTVVVSTDRVRCRKVRWSMVITVDGPGLGEVNVARIEDNGDFPVQVRNAGDDSARITDVQLDPGELCRGRTVTARYRIGFDDDADSGRVTFRAQAFDAGRTLLQEASSRSEVKGEDDDEEPEKTASPSPEPSPSPTESTAEPRESADDEETAEPEPTDTRTDVASVPTSGSDSGTPSLLGAGLIVGGILVFLGVGLLLRLRMRSRTPKHATQLPTGFYPAN